MEAFTRLYNQLDRTTKKKEKVRLLKDYFEDVPPEDAAWALF